MAEVIAFLHGVQFAVDMGFRRVIIEGDSRLVINNVLSPKERIAQKLDRLLGTSNLVCGISKSTDFSLVRERGTQPHMQYRMRACGDWGILSGLKMHHH